eukprot:CAMPEP_0185829480 /NCGR_PEP_ID=MMETSP1353-20130828/276_1 /TAXON_ID=1077150 /ORGANISM="Erythrolobus australicus, Strain CCMP3124" /LENGTH=70 /DNA_ID=CAMNT_0028527279 /DNA_START=121 /DNA_END=329 /DNA_ORIENTATION=+
MIESDFASRSPCALFSAAAAARTHRACSLRPGPEPHRTLRHARRHPSALCALPNSTAPQAQRSPAAPMIT